jgi:hypothetical protein
VKTTRPRLPSILGSTALLLALLTRAYPTAAEPQVTCTATVVPSPNLGTRDNVLNAVSATSSTDAWAVGYYHAGDPLPIDTLILHWNGAEWTVVDSPNPGKGWNILNGVSALSPTDAWAVGWTADKQIPGNSRSLILHWDGVSWSDAHPRLPKHVVNGLNAVHAVTTGDVWAVGSANRVGNLSGADTLTLHWDGLDWHPTASPNAHKPENGSNNNILWGADSASPSDVWSVGNFGDDDNANGDNSTLALRWEGSRWRIVKSPNPKPIDYFRGVSVVSSTEIWAAGYKMRDRYANPRALVASNDGTKWTVIPSDTLPSMRALGIDAASSEEVWIGGVQIGEDVGYPIVARWDGAAWITALPPQLQGSINGVAVAGDGTLWAIGVETSGFFRTLIERVACS